MRKAKHCMSGEFKSNEGERKVVGSKAAVEGGETGLVGTPSFENVWSRYLKDGQRLHVDENAYSAEQNCSQMKSLPTP